MNDQPKTEVNGDHINVVTVYDNSVGGVLLDKDTVDEIETRENGELFIAINRGIEEKQA